MKKLLFTLLLFTLFRAIAHGQSNPNESSPKKIKLLVHITQGPENPTRAALGFLVAKTAIEDGHIVSLFLAGDAVRLLQDSVLNTLTGVGTGKLSEHYQIIVKGKPAVFALPNVLVRLSIESDRMFTY